MYRDKINIWRISNEKFDNPIHTINEVCVNTINNQYELQEQNEYSSRSICFSPNNKFLAATNNIDKTIRIYNANRLRLFKILTGIVSIGCISFCDDNQTIIFVTYGIIIIWNFYENNIKRIDSEELYIPYVHYCENFIVLIDGDGTIKKYYMTGDDTTLYFDHKRNNNRYNIRVGCILREWK